MITTWLAIALLLLVSLAQFWLTLKGAYLGRIGWGNRLVSVKAQRPIFYYLMLLANTALLALFLSMTQMLFGLTRL
ncbi:hypothetical protein [Allopontixanthobacter sp.]|uniref:hypothetical protein n=1 Tax=Allopontixanthobacter sp. TaxID=2906452 RepID=UPI002AB8715A|nr:hypothetical protein [Allopontixanthobacter sp.]MDZ4306333.1 hypothetical protein [Allopontixanthobacter sp.]